MQQCGGRRACCPRAVRFIPTAMCVDRSAHGHDEESCGMLEAVRAVLPLPSQVNQEKTPLGKGEGEGSMGWHID
jgi:hypothetical protein